MNFAWSLQSTCSTVSFESAGRLTMSTYTTLLCSNLSLVYVLALKKDVRLGKSSSSDFPSLITMYWNMASQSWRQRSSSSIIWKLRTVNWEMLGLWYAVNSYMLAKMSGDISFPPANCVVVCEVECSQRVLRCFSTCFGAGDRAGDELQCFLGCPVVFSVAVAGSFPCFTCVAQCNSCSESTIPFGIGWKHCTEVPCQLRFDSVLDTIAWRCRISILSIDASVRVRGSSSKRIPLVIRSVTAQVATRSCVSRDATAPIRLNILLVQWNLLDRV